MKTEKILAILCGIYLFFLSTTISTAGYSISCGLLIIGVFWTYLKYRKKWSFPDKKFCILYATFFLLLFIAAIGVGDTSSFFSTLRYFYLSLPFWILYSGYLILVGTGKKISLYALYFAAVIPSLYGIYQFFSMPGWIRVDSFTAHPNTFSSILAFLIPFMLAVMSDKTFLKNDANNNQINFVEKTSKIIFFICILLSVFAMFLGQSRGGIAGFILGGFVIIVYQYILRKNRKFSYRIVGIGALVVVFMSCLMFVFLTTLGGRSYDNERILLAKSSYNMWLDHKVFGVGFNNWKKFYREQYILPEAKEPNLPHSHNAITNFYSTTGIIGGTGFVLFSIGLFIFLLKKMWQYPENPYIKAMLWAYIALFVESMVSAGIKDKFLMRMFFGYLGFTLALLNLEAMKRKGMIQNDEIVKLCEKKDM